MTLNMNMKKLLILLLILNSVVLFVIPKPTYVHGHSYPGGRYLSLDKKFSCFGLDLGRSLCMGMPYRPACFINYRQKSYQILCKQFSKRIFKDGTVASFISDIERGTFMPSR